MNVLMISLDATFLADKRTARGDTLRRHIEIAGMLSHLHVVVLSTGKARQPVRRHEGKLTVYPTQSPNKLMRVLDSFRIGARICRRERIDVLTTQDAFFTGLVGCAIGALFGIPLNVQVHADCIGNRHWMNERLLNRVLNVTGKAVLRRANNVRVVSLSEKEKMVRLGVPEDRVWNIPTGGGINVERFSSADGPSVRRKLLPEGCDKIVLFAGRLTKQKRIGDLLYAAKRVVWELPETVFIIVGEGAERARAASLCRSLGLDARVIFVGNVPYEQMPNYLAAADVFVLPSAYEGTARVRMEAVASGVPVVTTKVSGVSKLVFEGENGHIVPVGKAQELAGKLIRVLKRIEAYRQGAARRKPAARAYDRGGNLPRLVEMWSQIARR
jgi:teichuronic acid biosynthesis glycosyltransferase TuaC